jgi:hypothetical protein
VGQENAAVADRYRLYGRHFVQRGDGAAGARGALGVEGGDDACDPFAGFDWMATDLIRRRQDTATDTVTIIDELAFSTAAAAAAVAAAESEEEQQPTSLSGIDGAGTATCVNAAANTPPRSEKTQGAVSAPLVSPMAAETGFDFGVTGCHNLPLKTSSGASVVSGRDSAGSDGQPTEEPSAPAAADAAAAVALGGDAPEGGHKKADSISRVCVL